MEGGGDPLVSRWNGKRNTKASVSCLRLGFPRGLQRPPTAQPSLLTPSTYPPLYPPTSTKSSPDDNCVLWLLLTLLSKQIKFSNFPSSCFEFFSCFSRASHFLSMPISFAWLPRTIPVPRLGEFSRLQLFLRPEETDVCEGWGVLCVVSPLKAVNRL